jgi:hypothetical protein
MQTITIQNFNNKLNCNTFLHIAAAPAKALLESSFPIPIHVTETATSGPVSLSALKVDQVPTLSFEAEIIDLSRIELSSLSSLITFPSSGMSREDFIKHWQQQNPNASGMDMMAVYVFRKVVK